MADDIPCLLLNLLLWVFSLYLLLLYSILIKNPLLLHRLLHLMLLLHFAVDTVVSHFVSVVFLCFALNGFFLPLKINIITIANNINEDMQYVVSKYREYES